MKLTSLIATAFLCITPTFADSIALPFNTGVNNKGALASPGSVDAHYTSSEGAALSTVYVESAPVYLGGWVGADTLSAWVGPDTNYGQVNNGLYTADYSVTFDLTGYDPSSVVLKGQFSVDDYAYIYLNGVNTGISALNYSSWTPFTISSGFTKGLNIIDFEYTNGGGPGGLRVEFSGATGTATPEPASLALIGLGASALGLCRRKK